MVKRLVVGAVIVDDAAQPSRILAARRSTPPTGRWEFPGGKTEVGETPRAALVREIREELSALVDVGHCLAPPLGGRWPISESLEMELRWCTISGEHTVGDSHDEIRWLTAEDLDTVDWLDADRGALPLIRRRLVAPHGSGGG